MFGLLLKLLAVVRRWCCCSCRVAQTGASARLISALTLKLPQICERQSEPGVERIERIFLCMFGVNERLCAEKPLQSTTRAWVFTAAAIPVYVDYRLMAENQSVCVYLRNSISRVPILVKYLFYF